MCDAPPEMGQASWSAPESNSACLDDHAALLDLLFVGTAPRLAEDATRAKAAAEQAAGDRGGEAVQLPRNASAGRPPVSALPLFRFRWRSDRTHRGRWHPGTVR